MATPLTANDLVRRAENVGWLVSRGRTGWKVQTPKGPYPINSTYTDRRSLTNAARDLERMGLKEAEKNMPVEASKEERKAGTVGSEARIEAVFQSQEDVLTMAAEQAKNGNHQAMRAKAAGPYMLQPEDVTLSWFITPHPRPWARWVVMTPEIAKYLLANFNGENRRLRDRTVEHYRNIILSEQWHLTHQGGAMDTRPVLQDGQHRLQAIVEASEHIPDLAVPMLFCVGMPVENFKAIDEGLLRSAADLFGRGANAESYGAAMGAIIRLALAFKDQNPRRMMRIKTTNEKIYSAFEDKAEELRVAARFGVSHYKKCWASAAPLGAAYFLIREANGPDNKYVKAFFDGLLTGRKSGTRLSLEETDPREVARAYFQRVKMRQKRLTGIETLSIIVMAWNNIVIGHQPRFPRFTDDTPIPRITLCADTGPNASATPELLVGEIDED